MKDYYKILEVSPSADDAEIKKSFRKLAKKYHPDTNGGDKVAEERFQEVNEAYTILGDPEKKKAYDEERQGKRSGAAGPDSRAQAGGGAKTTKAPRGTFTGFNTSNFKMDFGDMMFDELNKDKKNKEKGQPDLADVSSQFASFFGFRPK